MNTQLDPNEDDAGVLWAEIHRLRDRVAGPPGFSSWQEAATAERVRRVKAERELAAYRSASADGGWQGVVLTDDEIDDIVDRHYRQASHQDSYAALRATIRDALDRARGTPASTGGEHGTS